MPVPKGRYPPARFHYVPEHTEPLCMSQCWLRWPEWPKRVAPETIDRGVDGGGRAIMQITIELPEDIAVGLESRWKDLPRATLESLALEAYRSRALTAAQLGRLLVFETRMQVDAFLKEHEIFDYSAADFEQDRETLRELRMKEARS
jgi:hypothetical protein